MDDLFDCLFCADPISPSLSSFIRSKAAATPSHPGFCPISIDPSPSSPSKCSFRRRLLEFMDMAFNPTNWWTIVCTLQQRWRQQQSEWRDAKRHENLGSGCAISAGNHATSTGTPGDWWRPRAAARAKGLFLAVRWMESERTERDCRRRRRGVDRRRLASSVRPSASVRPASGHGK